MLQVVIAAVLQLESEFYFGGLAFTGRALDLLLAVATTAYEEKFSVRREKVTFKHRKVVYLLQADFDHQ